MASRKKNSQQRERSHQKNLSMHRREFLRRSTATAAGAFVSLSRFPSGGEPEEKDSGGERTQLPQRRLGKTGLMVSVLACGGSPFVEDVRPPVPEKTLAKILHEAMELGLNFIDTSHLYGRGYSEKAFGKAIQGRREKVVIFSRCPMGWGRSGSEMIDESLERLQTDHIDVYGMHGTRMSEDMADRFMERLLPDLEKAKKAGKIGHIAATGHQAPTAMVKMIETGKIEVVQIPVNPFWREFLEVVLPVAKKKDVGVVAMKPLGRGRILGPSPEGDAILGSSLKEKLVSCIGFGLSQDLASVSIGFVHEPHLKEDIGAALSFLARGDKGFSEERAKLLRPKAHESVKENCVVCNRCLPCPVRIEVPRILRLELYHRHYGLTDWAKKEYERVRTKADKCTKCGKCTEQCPYGVPAQELVLKAAKELA
jgi:predicted aldo/keto reductase-like oxidoreductase